MLTQKFVYNGIDTHTAHLRTNTKIDKILGCAKVWVDRLNHLRVIVCTKKKEEIKMMHFKNFIFLKQNLLVYQKKLTKYTYFWQFVMKRSHMRTDANLILSEITLCF